MQTKWEEAESEKVCAFDIDGCLNDYPDPWVDFINKKLSTRYSGLNEAKRDVPYQLYKDLKYEYRESGIKAKLKARAGAAELTQKLKELGYMIMILTARPFDEHKTLFKQTTDFLRLRKIQYDGIIYGKQKHTEVIQRVPNLRFMVEDHRYNANMIAKWGYPVFLVDNKYNQGPLPEGVYRIKDLMEVLDYGFVTDP